MDGKAERELRGTSPSPCPMSMAELLMVRLVVEGEEVGREEG